MARKNRNPVTIRPDTSIGENSAENDSTFLYSCFVDHPALSAVEDIESPRLVLSGRTGSGKTAIMEMISHQKEHVSPVELEDMALDYVANSDIIRFLQSLEIDLDLFFQALWKHVLCIEFIRLRYAVTNENKSNYIFSQIKKAFDSDDRRKAALQYLRDWEGKFWITMDENIKEITQKFENRVDAAFNAEIAKFRSNAGYARTLSGEKRAQLVSRAKKIVNPSQLTELNKVLDLLSAYDGTNKQFAYYILIDRLDERWVDESLRFRLIRALIESLKAFRKIRGLKIIVSLRTDVLERVILENKDLGFQREKYDDYFLRILWKKEQLKDLVQKRVNYLYRRKYTSENVYFDDIFPKKIGNKDPFDYMIERTLYRPRDIISFVNICLQKAQGDVEVYPKHIKEAEAEYSRGRYQALVYEWKSAFPSLELVMGLLSGKPERFSLAEIANKGFVDEIALRYEFDAYSAFDPLYDAIKIYSNEYSTHNAVRVGKIVAAELYRIGAIGIKQKNIERYHYSHHDTPILNDESFNLDNKIHIHPMLHKALGIDRSNWEATPHHSRPLT